MASIAIIGPGAIGGTVAAFLLRAGGHAVSLCARTGFDTLEVRTPHEVLTSVPAVLTRPEAAGPADWVLVATKAYDVAATGPWLDRLMGPATRVAILQNGVEHRARFAGMVPDERLLPVIVDIPCERAAPGRIHQRRDGTMIVADGPAGRDFVGLFAPHPGLDVSATADFTTAAWRKLVINAPAAVNALLVKPAGVARREAVGEIMLALMREAVAVGRAEGAVLQDGLPETVLAGSRAGAPDGVNSLLADRMAGRTMEIDARNGAIVRFGRRHGVPTPMNALMVDLLEAAVAQDGF